MDVGNSLSMADEPTQVQTETSPAPTAGEQTPATGAAPVSTTSPAEVPSDSSGKVAGGVEGYMDLKERAIAEAHAKSQAKAAAPAAPVETAPSTTTEETPAPAASAGETTTTEETPASTTTEETPAPTGDEPTETTTTAEHPEEDAPDRIRIKGLKDGHLVATANQIARAEGITFDEAYERVRPKPAQQPTSTTPTSNLRSRGDVEADLATARQERRAAAVDADALKDGAQTRREDAIEKIEKLEKELKQVTDAEEQAEFEKEQTAEQKFQTDVRSSKLQAVKYWPDAGKDNTAFSNRMLELSDQYEADPALRHHVSAADAPFFFAQLVAKEMNIPPVHLQKKPAAPAPNGSTPSQPSTPTATRPAAVTQRAVTRPVQPAATPASGAARTTQEAPKDDFGVDKIKNVADYERVRDLALGKTR